MVKITASDDGRNIEPYKEAILFTVENCNFCNGRY